MKEAVELVNRFLRSGMTIEPAKRCALICVDEKIKTLVKTWNDDDLSQEMMKGTKQYLELEEVKQEIEKL